MRKAGSSPETFELTIQPEPWVQEAACNGVAFKDTDLFFGQRQELAAERYCANCPVTWQCFQYAARLEMHHGVWGGVPQWDRRTLLRNNLWRVDHRLQVSHAQYVRDLRIRARKTA